MGRVVSQLVGRGHSSSFAFVSRYNRFFPRHMLRRQLSAGNDVSFCKFANSYCFSSSKSKFYSRSRWTEKRTLHLHKLFIIHPRLISHSHKNRFSKPSIFADRVRAKHDTHLYQYEYDEEFPSNPLTSTSTICASQIQRTNWYKKVIMASVVPIKIRVEHQPKMCSILRLNHLSATPPGTTPGVIYPNIMSSYKVNHRLQNTVSKSGLLKGSNKLLIRHRSRLVIKTY